MRKLLLILGVVIVIIILFITISKILFDKRVIKEVGMLTKEGGNSQLCNLLLLCLLKLFPSIGFCIFPIRYRK